MDNIRLHITRSEVQGLPLGAVVRVVLLGKVTSISDGYEDGQAEVCVEGSAELEPTRISDLAKVAIAGLSDAKRPRSVPFVSGQELHAP